LLVKECPTPYITITHIGNLSSGNPGKIKKVFQANLVPKRKENKEYSGAPPAAIHINNSSHNDIYTIE